MRTYDFAPLGRYTVGFDHLFDLINQTAAIKPGESGRFIVRRGREQVELDVKTGRRPPIEPARRR